MHPQRIALEIERVGRERLGLTAADRIYASSKLFFAYPLANCIFTGLKVGATIILDPQWPTAQGVVASIMARRANVLFSVPSLYRNLLKEGLAGQLAQCGVRLYVSAGEALPATLRDEWKRQLVAVRPLRSVTGTALTCKPSTSATALSCRQTCSSAWKAAAGASPGATIR